MRLAIVVAVMGAAFGAAMSFAADGYPTLDPQKTKVAVLPVVNVTGEKWADLRQKQIDKGNEELVAQFKSRGFKLADAPVSAKAASDMGLDMSDEEQWTKANLYKVGHAAGADLIVFAVITDTTQRIVDQFLFPQREGTAKLKIWFLDVSNEKPILSASTVEGKCRRGPAGVVKGSEMQIKAVGRAIGDGLKSFLNSYPVMKDQQSK